LSGRQMNNPSFSLLYCLSVGDPLSLPPPTISQHPIVVCAVHVHRPSVSCPCRAPPTPGICFCLKEPVFEANFSHVCCFLTSTTHYQPVFHFYSSPTRPDWSNDTTPKLVVCPDLPPDLGLSTLHDCPTEFQFLKRFHAASLF